MSNRTKANLVGDLLERCARSEQQLLCELDAKLTNELCRSLAPFCEVVYKRRMPMYEYKCKSCGDVTEHLVGVGAEQQDIVCGGCGSDELAQMISIVSVTTGARPDTCCGGACDRESAMARCDGDAGACACGH